MKLLSRQIQMILTHGQHSKPTRQIIQLSSLHRSATSPIKLRQQGGKKLIISYFTLPHKILMSTKYSLHMAINFKRPQAMKSLNNDLGSIPGGRESELSSTLWLKNPKPTEADWQGKQQTLTWSHFATKNSWQKGGGQNNIQRGKMVGTIRDNML